MSLFLAGSALCGCAQQPQQIAASHRREYFPSSIYGNASRRVIADGQPIPKGGGQYLVGKPYKVAGRTYYPSESRATQVGNASWYGDAFHGRLTANGEIYDRDGLTAASPTMPLPSYARVTNLRNNYSMIVRVNDRGPYASDRIMDVSRRVAESLDFKRYGTTKLKVEYVGRASLAGSDDAKLYATLRTGAPAPWQDAPTMVAEAAPRRATVASIAPYAPVVERRPAIAPQSMLARHFAERTLRDMPEGPDTRAASPRPGRPRFAVAARESSEPIPPLRHRVEDLPKPELRRAFTPSRETDHRVDDASVRSAGLARHPILPPSRPMDLGTIPGAASQIHAAQRPAQHWHMARSRED